MGLSRTVSEIDDDFCRKSHNFSTLHFASPLKKFPLELGTGARGHKKTKMMGLLDRERSLTISSAVWIECTNGWSWRDGRTPRYSKDRAYA